MTMGKRKELQDKRCCNWNSGKVQLFQLGNWTTNFPFQRRTRYCFDFWKQLIENFYYTSRLTSA